MKIKSLAAAVMGAAMLFSVAACGTSDATDNNASAGASGSSNATQGFDVSSVAKDDAIAALVPDSVKSDGKLTVGMDTSYAPAEFLDGSQKPVGYDVDLAKALGKVMGLETEPVTSTFDSILPSIGSKYDIGISSFTITDERKDAVDFVSYYKAGSTWAVKKGNPEKFDSSNLCGLKIAVQTGTTQEEEVNADNEKCPADKKIEILSNKLQTDVTTNVVTGKAVAFYADSPVAGYAISQTGGQLESFGEDVGVATQGIAIKKGDSAMDEAVQKAVTKLMDDGTYAKILDQWGVKSGSVDKAEINPVAD
ncbi:ABC transporter substrate-binding protein [Bifidobacterium avesanii]|uniref:Transporter substrate-binding domain-containing protein n=1 Tax=Bifidobacterium avesanii TaxID=1798157 RepID=A0A7K3TFZ1_9BIFI|nr:ABC transporter substrate-binding protein [Bifidobacterium avesanii]KAB8290603.1 ABC transporter substrate-binding protein [Bifidobacterium avesanii]NEG77972.1 transporter substrate-binding domain-containing protein [Bifidobacterium avesanii]